MSKVGNKTLKQGLLNRLRVWFEQGRIIFPYGNDETRRLVNILLEELETHAWKDGDIVDKGRHNDMVMAMAHAVDCFSGTKGKEVPAFASTLDMSQWNAGSSRKNGRKYVGFW